MPNEKTRGESMTVVEVFRENVEAFMEQNGITQQEVADAGGITQATLSRALSGVHAPTLDTCEKIAKGLGVSFSSLVSGSRKKLSKST